MIKKENSVYSHWFQSLHIVVMMDLACMVVLIIQLVSMVKLISIIAGIQNQALNQKLVIDTTCLGLLRQLGTVKNLMNIMMKRYGLKRLVRARLDTHTLSCG